MLALGQAGHAHPPRSITDVADEWPSWRQIFDTLTLQAGFNTNTVIIGTSLLGLAAGIIGVFALLRKRSLVTDALSHATLPGIGVAFLLATALGVDGRSLPVLLLGAAAAGTLGVICIQALIRHTRLYEDAAIGIVLSVFFGAGIVALSYIQANAPAGAGGLNRFIYGQTAALNVTDTVVMGAIAAAAILATLLLLKELSLICFNDAFAKVDGWPVSFIDMIMMALVVAVTVAGLQAVGLILVVAMLIIPPVAARFWTERLWLLVLLGGLIGALSGYSGSVVSALLPRKPAGAVIVLTTGIIFLISMTAAPARGVIAAALRQMRLRLRIAGEHILEAAFERAGKSGAGYKLAAADVAVVARRRAWPFWFTPLVLHSLRRQGYLHSIDGGIAITDAGAQRGARVHRNHRLWEQYLISYADVAPSHVDWSVDQVEHVLSEKLIDELESELADRGIVVPPHPAAANETEAAR